MPDFYGRSVFNDSTAHTCGKPEPPKPPSIPTVGYFGKVRRGDPLPIGEWYREFLSQESFGTGVYDASYHNIYSGTKHYSMSGDIFWPGSQHAGSRSGLAADVDGFSIAAMKNEAVSRAKNTAFDISTFAAEANKTYDLVRHAQSRWEKRVLDILTRRGPGRVIRTFAEFASMWMEYRYGWRLLAYDLEAADNSVQRLKEAKRQLDRYTVHEQQQASRTYGYGAGSLWFPQDGDFTSALSSNTSWSKMSGSSNVVSTLKVDHRVGAGVMSSLFHSVTVNPLLTLWEVIPYSFIVDWFIDVGNMIGASSPTFGRDLRYLWYTKTETQTTTFTANWGVGPLRNADTFLGNSGNQVSTLKEVHYHRQPITFDPWVLNMNLNLDFKKFLDFASLAIMRDNATRRSLRI